MNEGNLPQCSSEIQNYIASFKKNNSSTNGPYSARYIGSLVADFHRNLIKGGIYLYPSSTKSPNGKLRLLYECSPLAFLAEQAGGMAISNTERILDIQPKKLHQSVPFYIGSKEMIKEQEVFLKGGN